MSQAKIFSNVIREWGQSVQTGNVNGLYHYPALLDQVNDIGEQLQNLGVEMEGELQLSEKRLSLTMLSMKAQAATDLLHRGLFERTADVGAMAGHTVLAGMLKKAQLDENDFVLIHELLEKYVYEYSIYDDVIILDKQGRTVASLQGEYSANFYGSAFFSDIIKTPSYVEHFQFVPHPVLFYGQQIRSESNELLGAMVLSFQFAYEMENEIFPDVLNGEKGMDLLMITQDRRVAASTSEHFRVGGIFPTLTGDQLMLNGEEYDVVVKDTNGYEGYMGFGLQGVALKRPSNKSSTANKNKKKTVNPAAVPATLRRIITNVENVETDLHIVGLNGKLQAGREDDKTLPPILDGIRDSGAKIRSKFQEVIGDLVEDTEVILEQKAAAISKMAMVVMDHNLYERANDVCWWADSAVYRQILSKSEIDETDKAILEAQLAATNELYTVYDHLFVFDRNGTIIADSKPDRSHRFCGLKLENQNVNDVLRNRNSKSYFVSSFGPSQFYDDRATYIYYATIFAPGFDTAIGGIGLVFDSAVQFETILQECLDAENEERDANKAFGLFVNKRGIVIASSSSLFEPGQRFEPGKIDKELYVISNADSVGYREYLRNDGHNIDKTCLVAIPRG